MKTTAMNLNDAQFDQIVRLGNAAIHECVFAMQHALQGDCDDCLNCLVEVQRNAEQISDVVLSAQREEMARLFGRRSGDPVPSAERKACEL